MERDTYSGVRGVSVESLYQDIFPVTTPPSDPGLGSIPRLTRKLEPVQ